MSISILSHNPSQVYFSCSKAESHNFRRACHFAYCFHTSILLQVLMRQFHWLGHRESSRRQFELWYQKDCGMLDLWCEGEMYRKHTVRSDNRWTQTFKNTDVVRNKFKITVPCWVAKIVPFRPFWFAIAFTNRVHSCQETTINSLVIYSEDIDLESVILS